MKIIFSILMLPVFFVAPLIAGMTFLVHYSVSGGGKMESETLYHIYMCIVHLSMALGLIGGLLTFLYCAVMCIIGFIIKSWYRAALAGGFAFGMGYCVWYLNSVAL